LDGECTTTSTLTRNSKVYDRIKPFQGSNLETYVLFNNLSMFEDAKRFQHYLHYKEFPRLSGGAALETVKAVIERTRYPVTKSVLIDKVGWRVVELGEGRQMRLEELLRNIPSKKFADPTEVINEMELESSD